jgi:hypothetical protein
LNPATDDPVPDSPDSRPRLGDLLLSSGLITQEQLDESLTLARTAEKPLGHVLVERGLVPAHSIAMALADQHGGPLKTEFGFATGRGSVPRPAALPDQARSGAPPVLRLASAPLPEEPAQSAEAAARLGAEAQATELRARVEELESDLAAERSGRAAEAAALAANEVALAAAREELAAALDDAQSLHATLSGERESQQEVTAAAEALRARVTELEAAARRAETRVVALDTVDELRAVIELQEQALATASARELASTHRYSPGTHFLFAPSADGYDLLERSGPSPTPGEVVELSGGRTCRVLRVGPPPFPGAPEACAYLELV